MKIKLILKRFSSPAWYYQKAKKENSTGKNILIKNNQENLIKTPLEFDGDTENVFLK